MITIGADPELFLVQGDNLKSSVGLIGGNKEYPRAITDRPGFFVQEDNVAVEFNIPPAKTLQEFVDSINWSLSAITSEVDKFGMKPADIASALFPPSELLTPQAQTFGCNPDFNAWKNGKRNPRPRSRHERLRTCSGNIHVGSDVNKIRAVQLMDLYLSVPAVLMDKDKQRRQLYGKAGSFRPTDYGFEHRTLSNFWIFKPQLVEWAYTQTIRAINHAKRFTNEKDYDSFMTRYDLQDDIVKAINKNKIDLAHQLCVHYDLDVR